MYTKQPKKLLIMNILDILRKFSDADHRLSQQDILHILQTEYEMKADRKAVKRNLMDLIDFGYDINYSEKVRIKSNGDDEIVYTDWYIEREFTDAELRLMIDSLLFSKQIPYSQCRMIINKITGLSNKYFKTKMKHVCSLPNNQPRNDELFFTIEILDESIEKNRKVMFLYGEYGTDKKLHTRLTEDGEPKKYIVNPYQMVAANGRYYLIANVDKYDNISHFRVDKISDIQMLDDSAKPIEKITGLQNGLDLPKHMAEHIYMFSGESSHISMITTPDMAGQLIDWFGSGVTFTDRTEDSVIAHVTANEKAMRYWALQYAPYVTILSPKKLADSIKEDLKNALLDYEELSDKRNEQTES